MKITTKMKDALLVEALKRMDANDVKSILIKAIAPKSHVCKCHKQCSIPTETTNHYEFVAHGKVQCNGKVYSTKAMAERNNLPYGTVTARKQMGWSADRTFNTPLNKEMSRRGKMASR